jgi:hypothetical protein
MAKVSIATLNKAPLVAAAGAGVETHAHFARAGDPIHMHHHLMQPGATLRLDGTATDRIAYVWKGWVEAGGAKLDARSSLIVELGTSVDATAGADGATLIAFNLRDRPARHRGGGHVHLLPYEQVPKTDDLTGNGLTGGAIHADAQCPTCELWLHENDFNIADCPTPLHSHSEDEVIFVRDGSMRLGNKLYGAGTAIAIQAHAKYAFSTGPDGLSFINFRGTSPSYIAADGTEHFNSATLWQEKVGSPRYLEPQAV